MRLIVLFTLLMKAFLKVIELFSNRQQQEIGAEAERKENEEIINKRGVDGEAVRNNADKLPDELLLPPSKRGS